MYLKGSKWSVTHRKKRSNPFNIILLVLLIGVAVYVNQVVIPVTGPLFVPTNTPTRDPEAFITDAQAIYLQGKLEPAIKAYQTAIPVNPKNVDLYLTLAKLEIDTGQLKDAIIQAENALLVNPNNSNASAILGYAQGLSGDYLASIASLNKAISQDSKNGVAFAYYAEILTMQYSEGKGDLNASDKIDAALQSAITLAPDALETHSAHGLAYETFGKYQDAVNEFTKAVQLNANIASLHLALGRNYKYIGNIAGAIEQFNLANTLNPNDPNPTFYISKTYGSAGEYAKAIQYAEEAIKTKPDDPVFFASLYGNLGSLYYKNHDYVNAVSNLRLAVRGGTDPDGNKVVGLKLDYGTVATYYYIYGLALARDGAQDDNCGEALQLSQLIQQGVPNDDTAQYNAQEMINICKNLANNTTATPAGSETLQPGLTATPKPFPTHKPTFTLVPTFTPTRTHVPTATATPKPVKK